MAPPASGIAAVFSSDGGTSPSGPAAFAASAGIRVVASTGRGGGGEVGSATVSASSADVVGAVDPASGAFRVGFASGDVRGLSGDFASPSGFGAGTDESPVTSMAWVSASLASGWVSPAGPVPADSAAVSSGSCNGHLSMCAAVNSKGSLAGFRVRTP